MDVYNHCFYVFENIVVTTATVLPLWLFCCWRLVSSHWC